MYQLNLIKHNIKVDALDKHIFNNELASIDNDTYGEEQPENLYNWSDKEKIPFLVHRVWV